MGVERASRDAPPPRDATATATHGAATWVADLYEELRQVAGAYCGREASDQTLQPTALVHEVYLKLQKPGNGAWKNATHFRAVAASAMRQILVDRARARATLKRGGGRLRALLDDNAAVTDAADVDLLDLDVVLEELAHLDERKYRVVEMRFFGGLTTRQAADALSISPKTAEADWYMARAWLRKRLREQECRGARGRPPGTSP
jgi:RNA polymerase sigma factor (TIGR02999 family)